MGFQLNDTALKVSKQNKINKFIDTHIRIDFFGENFQFLRRELGEKIVDIDIVEFLELFAVELLGRHGVGNLVGDLGIASRKTITL
jgi:hypothetical protein